MKILIQYVNVLCLLMLLNKLYEVKKEGILIRLNTLTSYQILIMLRES